MPQSSVPVSELFNVANQNFDENKKHADHFWRDNTKLVEVDNISDDKISL